MKKFFNMVDELIVINLKKDKYRKLHAEKQFIKLKIKNYSFFNAISHEDTIVKDFYLENKVAKFPPCFRCSNSNEISISCNHDNNFLTPKQVANFLSFYKVMEEIVNRKVKNVIVFEDDFKFKFFAKKSFSHLNNFMIKNNFFQLKEPLLIRLGSHTRVRKMYYIKRFLLLKSTFIERNVEDMANPAFFINYYFANHFLNKFINISTTSDNFIHRELCEFENIVNFSLYPFPIEQLSYGKKINKFKSTISDENSSNIGSFESIKKTKNPAQYQKLLEEWLSS